MITARVALRSIGDGFARRYRGPHIVRTLSTTENSGNGVDGRKSNDSFESADEFEQRIFGGLPEGSSSADSFFRKLDRLEKGHDRSDSKFDGGHSSSLLDGLDDSFDALSDGMDRKLKKAAMYFEVDPEEIEKEDYAFRPDMSFRHGMTYDIKDLDLTKPGVRKVPQRYEFKVTTEEVLRKADFRNVRFLANFITEAGVIIKRSKTRISAKAQRKVAREIKTARAFGLMPFTTMGTKSFIFGKTMEDQDKDYEYESYDSSAAPDLDRNADF